MGVVESSGLLERVRGAFPQVDVPLELVDGPAEQLRLSLDPEKLEELSRSIAARGLMQRPGLRAVGGRYEVVWGHRRTEAVRLLGWLRLPAVLVEGDADELVVMGAAENWDREDLSPVEEAAACRRLYGSLGEDVSRVAARIKRSKGWVESRLRLLSWPADVLASVHGREISSAAGAELAAISDDQHRAFLLGHAVRSGATARTCQAWRIAWEQTGVAPDVSVHQVGPGGTIYPPTEAELPCYCCGRRQGFSALTHVWLDAECLRVTQEAWEIARGVA